MKTTLYFAIVALIIYLMIQINYSHLEHLEPKVNKPYTLLQMVDRPINLFAFLGGLLTSFVSILLTQVTLSLKK
ncbi:hypothetical protein [Mycoplasma sp. CR]|uniref:hypothetical protein n=1 Tax=unclassified Mycoplasma TaxID=2683645 RepID=UPI003AADC906